MSVGLPAVGTAVRPLTTKNVLITGGTGFIGSNLAAKLVELGCKVRVLRRDGSDLSAIGGIDVEHCIGDLLDINSIKTAMQGCSVVFHTAAIVTFRKSGKAMQHHVNVFGTRNVVQACLATGVGLLVHTSSIAALGYPPDGELATEQTAYNWGTEPSYKYSKHLAEQEVLAGVERGVDAVIVNPAVVIGERDINFHGGDLIRRIKQGLVPVYIDGGMNVVYVGDVVRGHINAAVRGRTGERYILGGENLTHKEIFFRTAKLIGGRAPFARLPLPLLRAAARTMEAVSNVLPLEPLITPGLVSGAGRKNWYSSAKAIEELDYHITPFDQTILAAYNWYRASGHL